MRIAWGTPAHKLLWAGGALAVGLAAALLPPTLAVALLAGARWVDMGASLRYRGEIANPDADAGKSWIDPLVGIHVFAPLSDRWWFGLHGDVGGFGVGSELTWQAYGDIGFQASDLVSIVLGYRALDMDYEDGEGLQFVGLDLLISGPQLGVVQMTLWREQMRPPTLPPGPSQL